MKITNITDRQYYPQRKEEGGIVSYVGEIEMIVFDNLSQKYRLINLGDGLVYMDEYKTIKELFDGNGELELVSSAELVVEI